MADWAAFASVTGVVTFLVLLLAHASQSLVRGGTVGDPPDTSTPESSTSESPTAESSTAGMAWKRSAFEPASESIESAADGDGSTAEESSVAVTDSRDRPPHRTPDPAIEDLSTSTLLVNVAATQGFFALFLLGGVWYAQVPLSALGVAWPSPSDLALGAGFGVVLFGANQAATSAGRRFDVGGGEQLRAALAPESFAGWALLLLVVLPVVAGFEELLFRGALVGGLGAGFAVSTGLLVVLSSVAFALGHGAQGRAGIVVTGVIGLVFAGAFVWTGSLVVVVVAHYLVNALEFVVHEGPVW